MIGATVIFRRVFSRPNVKASRAARVACARLARKASAAKGAINVIRAAGAFALLVMGMLAPLGRTQQITLILDDLTGAAFSAQSIKLAFVGGGAAAIDIGALTVGAQSWKHIHLECKQLALERARIACDEGVLPAGEKIPLSFSYATDQRVLSVALKPAPDETWQMQLRPGRQGNDLTIRMDGGRLQRVAAWWPPDLPKINAGVVDGVIEYEGDGRIAAKLSLSNAGFADAVGLHAGEKLGISMALQAEPDAQALRWRAQLAWSAGEVFWQPLYLKSANQQLSMEGRLDAAHLRVARGSLRYPGIGDVTFSGDYDLGAKKVTGAQASAQAIPVAALYESVLKPFLDGSTLSDLRTDGRVSAEVHLGVDGLQRVDVQLDNVSLEDKTQHRFALFNVNGLVPWRAREATQAAVTVKGGELLKMPVGAFAVPLGMNGMRFDLKQLRVPLLDGYFEIRDFAARAGTANWNWQFTGDVGGISMDKITAALGLPVMQGTLAATLPMVRHIRSTFRVDGALFLKVFNGSIEVKNLVLLDLFSKAPRVQADVAMRNLDLGLVTSAFSFGNMTGRVDARIAGLELVNWQPVKFDVRVASSAGDYPRKISQAAVQNISALGGAGAAAAIQRSFLRFFEQFGYDRLGWSCKLQNGLCEMGGVEGMEAAQGYVIVKGGGIPAITVMGYNRQVSWQELLDRLKRVTQGNVKPIVE